METNKLVWSIHPLRSKPVVSISLILLLPILYIMTFHIFPNLIVTTLAFFAFFMSLRGYFFKTTYTLLQDTIQVSLLSFRYTKKISDFKKYYIGPNALLLSPFKFKTRLNRYRGIYISFPQEMRTDIEKIISAQLECGSTNHE